MPLNPMRAPPPSPFLTHLPSTWGCLFVLSLPYCRAEKAAWQKAQKSLEVQAERGKRAAEEARARLAEQENAIKAIGLERRASQQERCVGGVWIQYY